MMVHSKSIRYKKITLKYYFIFVDRIVIRPVIGETVVTS